MGRVVVFSLDGASPWFLDSGLADGSLATLRRLFERGRCLRLVGPHPYLPAVSTVTMIAGVGLAEHQQQHTRQLRPGTYSVADSDPADRRFAPFWQFVSDAGLRSTIVSMETAPLLEDFHGTQVVGWGDSSGWNRQPAFDPPEVRDWLREVAPHRRAGGLSRVPETHADFRAYVQGSRRQMLEHARAAKMLLERTEWDLFVVSFDMLHEGGHLLWGAFESRDPGTPHDLRAALPSLYRSLDQTIGDLIDAVPPDALLLVVSAKGIGPTSGRPQAVEAFLRAGGWLAPYRGAELRGGRLRSLKALRRAVRRALPLSLRRSLARPILAWRDRIDANLASPAASWSMTDSRAFPLPHEDEVWLIRLNLAGREPTGVVARSEYDETCSAIESAARELVDENGAPAVRDVIRMDAVLGAEVRDVFPDLIVTFRDDLPTRSLRWPRFGPIAAAPADRPFRTGVHRDGGFIVGVGEGVSPSGTARLPSDTAGLLDVAPTILRRLGVPIPAHMMGRPIPDFV